MANAKKSALITGGTRGIGAAIAKALSASGVACTVTGRSDTRPDTIPDFIDYLSLDFLDEGSIAAFVDACKTKLRPDILVNNAGINQKAAILDFSSENFDDILSVNLRGPYAITRACLPYMIENKWGRIINITSIWSVLGNARNSAYCASKFGLDGFTVALAAEVAHHGILVNAIAPGYVLTEEIRTKYTDAELKKAITFIPAGRIAEPAEIGAFALWLASEQNTYISGQNIRIDGGLTRTSHPYQEVD